MDSITLQTDTAAGISHALGQDFYRVELPDRMAWVVWQLKSIDDREEFFPHGKWATIQSIEQQLQECVAGSLIPF